MGGTKSWSEKSLIGGITESDHMMALQIAGAREESPTLRCYSSWPGEELISQHIIC